MKQLFLYLVREMVLWWSRTDLPKKKIFFHQDNAHVHENVSTMDELNEFKYELLVH